MLQNINEIKEELFYKPSDLANLFDCHESTITRKCQSKQIISKNIGTEKRSTWRILWKDLLKYLKN